MMPFSQPVPPLRTAESVSSVSRTQSNLFSPALPPPLTVLKNVRKIKLAASFAFSGSHSFIMPSFSTRVPGVFHDKDFSATRLDYAELRFGRISGSPLRRPGVFPFANAIPFRAMKRARAAGLALDGGIGGVPLAIAIRDLALSVKSNRGDVPVLKKCSLNVPEGQLWMLLGPNGCGKSTLLKAMAGLLRPNAGRMFIIGPRSFVFQNPDYQVVMPSAEADVAFGSGRFDLPPEQRSVQTLSGGQKQRIAVAGALAESSRLLLLDELTTYLERDDQIGVLEAVLKVVRGPTAVTALWVTHRLEELEYADGAVYMENGRVVLSGSVADVKQHIRIKQEFQKSGT